jgi:hypothetical protein
MFCCATLAPVGVTSGVYRAYTVIFGGLPAIVIAALCSVDCYELHSDGTLSYIKVGRVWGRTNVAFLRTIGKVVQRFAFKSVSGKLHGVQRARFSQTAGESSLHTRIVLDHAGGSFALTKQADGSHDLAKIELVRAISETLTPASALFVGSFRLSSHAETDTVSSPVLHKGSSGSDASAGWDVTPVTPRTYFATAFPVVLKQLRQARTENESSLLHALQACPHMVVFICGCHIRSVHAQFGTFLSCRRCVVCWTTVTRMS